MPPACQDRPTTLVGVVLKGAIHKSGFLGGTNRTPKISHVIVTKRATKERDVGCLLHTHHSPQGMWPGFRVHAILEHKILEVRGAVDELESRPSAMLTIEYDNFFQKRGNKGEPC